MKNSHKLFNSMAQLVAQQSTCCRLKVGAVLVKDNRVISMGFNGVASKQEHCEDIFKKLYEEKYKNQFATLEDFLKSKEFYDLHGQFSNDNELHITLSPCTHCAKIITAAGIEKVYFSELYDRSQEGVNLLKKNNIPCEQLKF